MAQLVSVPTLLLLLAFLVIVGGVLPAGNFGLVDWDDLWGGSLGREPRDPAPLETLEQRLDRLAGLGRPIDSGRPDFYGPRLSRPPEQVWRSTIRPCQ